jgi:hypothetical protein
VSEDTTKDNIIPAQLSEKESIIADSSDKVQSIIDEIISQPTATEITAEKFGIKVSKPTAMPETDDNNIIGSSETTKTGGTKKGNLRTSDNTGALVSGAADRNSSPTEFPNPELPKMAVFSTRNVTMNGVGKVYRGYNIVSEAEAKEWLKRDHIRLATPEEIAEEFGK